MHSAMLRSIALLPNRDVTADNEHHSLLLGLSVRSCPYSLPLRTWSMSGNVLTLVATALIQTHSQEHSI